MLRHPLRYSAFPLPFSVELIERRRAVRFTLQASDPEVVIAIYFKDVNVPADASVNEKTKTSIKTPIMRAQHLGNKKEKGESNAFKKIGYRTTQSYY